MPEMWQPPVIISLIVMPPQVTSIPVKKKEKVITAPKVRELKNSISEFPLVFSTAHILTISNMLLIAFITVFKVLPDRPHVFCLIVFSQILTWSPYYTFSILFSFLFANTRCMMNCVPLLCYPQPLLTFLKKVCPLVILI